MGTLERSSWMTLGAALWLIAVIVAATLVAAWIGDKVS